MTQNNTHWGYHLLAITIVCIWGMTFISTKILTQNGLSPQAIFFYRFALAYLLIWFIKPHKSPRELFAHNWRDEAWMFLAGITGGTLYFLTENSALTLTLTSNVSFIICTAPLLTTLIAPLFYKSEHLNKRTVIGSTVALVGVGFVVFNGNQILKLSPMGDLLTLTAALMWAFYSLILKRLGKSYSMVFVTRKIFFYGAISAIPLFFVEPLPMEWEVLGKPEVLYNLLFLTIVASLGCFILWNTCLHKLGVVQASNYIYLTPLATLLGSALILSEPITAIALLGLALILVGVYWAEKG
ncbi:MAG: DMT family transporter [Phocaeicola sp.]